MNTESKYSIEDIVNKTILKTLHSINFEIHPKEWMTLKEAAAYSGVSYNTFIKFRTMGLKVTEIDGVKRVSKKEVDRFMESYSF
ncbi:helix-turn-helix domain-containing protein [Lysinibacillus irui]|uniref:Helix-turn-helix domain-containing protein n=1 Tax=Lysinibacillus irui TaxID=2998077 RepID=A0AAJ5RN93_9BACI|nr:helix-turn-helix domain-containing protein [Lysinibacillus irui]WDV06155.1 helix-turn-helix domain-containing protein [Lysinibacillus irui]